MARPKSKSRSSKKPKNTTAVHTFPDVHDFPYTATPCPNLSAGSAECPYRTLDEKERLGLMHRIRELEERQRLEREWEKVCEENRRKERKIFMVLGGVTGFLILGGGG